MDVYFKGVEAEKVIYPRLADLAATGSTIYAVINTNYLPEEIKDESGNLVEYEVIDAVAMNMSILLKMGKDGDPYFEFNINLPHVLVQVHSNGNILFYDSINKDNPGCIICVISTESNVMEGK